MNRKGGFSHQLFGAGSIADIDEMLVMVDGVIGFDYSADVRLVSTDGPPEIRTIAGERTPLRQHHFQKP
jgi:hypothetical protein